MLYKNETSSIPVDPPDTKSDVSTDKKRKSIDEMIEDLNKDNPAKNQKRKYRGVF